MVKIEIRNLSKNYSSSKKITEACKGISLNFSAGSITGLIGPNGAGKTTLLKAIAGFHYADEGEIEFTASDGIAFTNDYLKQRKYCGLCEEEIELNKKLTVYEILWNEIQLYGIPVKNASKLIENAIELCEIQEVLEKKAGELSKGFMHRVNIARILSRNPDVILLDEYSSGLDPNQILHMKKVLEGISKTKAVFVSTHHLEEASSVCSDIYVMNRGLVKAHGSMKELLEITGKKTLEQAFNFLTE